MRYRLTTLLIASLIGSTVPPALWAVEPDVSIESKPKAEANPDLSCVRVPDSYLTTGPFTVQELEEHSLREWDKNIKADAAWKEFLRQLRKGDQLLMYDEGCCTGIIIVRKSCIVDWFPISEE